MIEEKKKEFKNHDKKLYDKRIMIFQEIQKLSQDKELNKNQQSTEEYYCKQWSFIHYSRQIGMPKSDLNLNEALYFLDIDLKIENGILVCVKKYC